MNDDLPSDVHTALLNVLLQLSRTVAVAHLTPDECKMWPTVCTNTLIPNLGVNYPTLVMGPFDLGNELLFLLVF